jgi:hypothetical protein
VFADVLGICVMHTEFFPENGKIGGKARFGVDCKVLKFIFKEYDAKVVDQIYLAQHRGLLHAAVITILNL